MGTARAIDLPVELWLDILHYLPVSSLKNLACVCRYLHTLATEALFNTVSFSGYPRSKNGLRTTTIKDTGRHAPTEHRYVLPPGVSSWIFDPDLVHAIFRDSHVWRKTLRHAYIFCNPRFACRNHERQLAETVIAMAQLFYESEVLQSLHISIPDNRSQVPFQIQGLTSLCVKPNLPGVMGLEMEYQNLFQLFQIPTLRKFHVQLPYALRDLPIPSEYHQPGISNVIELSVSLYGWFWNTLDPLLQWPRDLQSLAIDSLISDHRMVIGGPSGKSVDFNSIYQSLVPVCNSLRSFEYCYQAQSTRVSKFDHCGRAFQPFPQLQTVKVCLEMLMEFSHWMPWTPRETGFMPGRAPHPQTRLPPTLRHLTIFLARGFPT
jgi:hypothetical protein